ncbi:efflux RND transporter permease subunit [Steroidobacter cummioxidans]|uniref:efflux RND transporter permease subunit n=1 Tax=Steroidobacter cummioxidans TaxID=1803913 RepID=UPI000E31A19C|nr:multidrug efflux RND transporter permease subunit [Steroidobacter cummioxidans]
MSISSFFIDRPIFASVLSIIIVVSGLVALPLLPISEFPGVVPPTVVVSGRYPGASPTTIAETVITPLEQQINGVEHALYLDSSANPDGSFAITVTFALGTNLDDAQVQTQNRVSQAEPRLPDVVRQLGLVTQKRSPDLTMVVFLRSPDRRYDSLYLRNYAVIQVRDVLARLPGMGDVRVFGSGDYAMRLWLDPGKIAARSMTVEDVLSAVREQNEQVAAGQIGGQPAMPGTQFGYIVNAQGRLRTEAEFGNIIIKSGDGGDVVYLRDVARIELGPETYNLRSMLDSAPAVGIPVFQLPGANALTLSNSVRAKMEELSRSFPEGLTYDITYDPTVFVRHAIRAVVDTLFEAILLVVLVVVVFLQTWRASVVPLVAVPVAIVGTLAALLLMGFSINALTLFGLVLATGIVVDDAIVVVENIERKIEGGLEARAAAHAAMAEVTRPIISIMLVLCAVFVPVAFLSGITGQFYRQFAVTIAASTVISTFNSLTLSPALAALLLRPKHAKPDRFQRVIDRVLGKPFAVFNRFFERISHAYGLRVADVARWRLAILAVFVVLLGCTWLMFRIVPGGFIPTQDKQYLIAVIQLPNAASLDRTEQVVRQVSDLALATPGVQHAIGFPGLSANGFVNMDNAAVMFLPLRDFSERRTKELSAAGIASTLSAKLASIPDAYILVVPPPAVQGLGTTGGFKLFVEDRAGAGYDELAKVTGEVLATARQQPELLAPATYTSFQNSVPQLYADVDRDKVKRQGIALSSIFDTLQTYLGSSYVNDFNLFGRTFRVYAQAEARFRARPDDIANLKTRNAAGEMVPIGSVARVRFITGPDRVLHYNVYLAADVNGQAAPGYSSGQATAAMERVLAQTLPNGYSYEWTELAFQQKSASGAALLVFPLCVLLVFLILAAQYESWALPLAIVLIVPMCVLFSLIGVKLSGWDNNILTQIGFIVLVGLACKNAILIVEFARTRVEQGMDVIEAAIEACRLRLRPILMTSFAFIMGVVPLVTATGAGSELRRAMGIAVFSGMLGVTLFGLFLTPVFFVAIELVVRRKRSPATQGPEPAPEVVPGGPQ